MSLPTARALATPFLFSLLIPFVSSCGGGGQEPVEFGFAMVEVLPQPIGSFGGEWADDFLGWDAEGRLVVHKTSNRGEEARVARHEPGVGWSDWVFFEEPSHNPSYGPGNYKARASHSDVGPDGSFHFTVRHEHGQFSPSFLAKIAPGKSTMERVVDPIPNVDQAWKHGDLAIDRDGRYYLAALSLQIHDPSDDSWTDVELPALPSRDTGARRVIACGDFVYVQFERVSTRSLAQQDMAVGRIAVGTHDLSLIDSLDFIIGCTAAGELYGSKITEAQTGTFAPYMLRRLPPGAAAAEDVIELPKCPEGLRTVDDPDLSVGCRSWWYSPLNQFASDITADGTIWTTGWEAQFLEEPSDIATTTTLFRLAPGATEWETLGAFAGEAELFVNAKGVAYLNSTKSLYLLEEK